MIYTRLIRRKLAMGWGRFLIYLGPTRWVAKMERSKAIDYTSAPL